MPTYSYRCETVGCRHVWDEVKDMHLRDNETYCPICMNDYVVRIYNPTAVTFKGDGFYSTDKDKK